MAKTKISEYDSTAANNTDVDSVNIAEGCAPSGINNAIRQMMSHLKDFQTGAVGDNHTVGGNLAVTGTTALTGLLTASGGVSGAVTSSNATITGGTINGTTVGATTPAAVTATNLTVNTAATIASADINAGTIDGAVIGGASAQAVTGTLVTANTGFVGGLTGNVTGNLTGNVTGNVTGDVTGNLTGNVTAATGSSTFNDVVINGGLNMNAGTAATITNLTNPTNAQDAATKAYVDTSISNLVDTAPATLDTLNELAAALGDDPNFSTTITNSIATKLPLAGGTMSGAIAMGTNKITGLGDPLANQDAATKAYVDTQDATKLSLAGGTMSGAIAMGTNKITGVGDPTLAQDAATKNYIDVLFGSTSDAATSAAAAATSASEAATSASNASTSATQASGYATDASNSANAAAATYDAFDDRYLGSKASAPSVDNDGNALLTGALYWDTTAEQMRVYTGSSWTAAGSAVNGTSSRQVYTATASQTTFAITYDVGFVDVYLNGVKLIAGTDFTATSGTNIVLATGATAGDLVDIVAYGAFEVANTYTQAAADALFVAQTDIGTTVQAYDANNTTATNTQTLTNKTIAYASNTLTGVAPTSQPTLTGVIETKVAMGANDIDLSAGNYFTKTISGATTLTVSNVASSGSVSAFVLELTNGGSAAVTFFSGVTWAAATPPTLTAAGVDTLAFFTSDGGTTWRGFVLGLGMA